MKLPLGCHFVPKDPELIECLSNKVNGLPDIGEGFITDGIDVYRTSLDDLRANGGHKKRYYFTPAKFKNSSSRCRDRRTPDGYWKSNDKKHKVFDKEGKMVGFVQDLTHKGGANDGKTAQNWKMKEYTLPECDSSDHVVLCVIYNTKKPDENANSSQMLVQNQSTSPNNAAPSQSPSPSPSPAPAPSPSPAPAPSPSPAPEPAPAPAPADGITTGYPNDDIFNDLPPLEPGSGLLGSSSRNDDDLFLASLMSDVGWQEHIWLRNEQDSFMATFPSGSRFPGSSFVDNEAASTSETLMVEELWNHS